MELIASFSFAASSIGAFRASVNLCPASPESQFAGSAKYLLQKPDLQKTESTKYLWTYQNSVIFRGWKYMIPGHSYGKIGGS